MTLFDLPEPDKGVGPFRVEVWAPVGAGWIPMDRIESGGGWTFAGFNDAVRAAEGWVASMEVIDPRARVFDMDTEEPVWVS